MLYNPKKFARIHIVTSMSSNLDVSVVAMSAMSGVGRDVYEYPDVLNLSVSNRGVR